MSTFTDRIVKILRECEVEEKDIYNEDLVGNEILESLQIAEIVIQIEEEFQIEIDGADIIPENFINLKHMELLIKKYLDNGTGGGVKPSLRNEILWDMIARNSQNQVEQSGWKSSLTGKLFSEKEMDEFAKNVQMKLRPYIHKECRVIEIGIGSGIIAAKIAPYVKEYIGIDISNETLRKTEERFRKEDIRNIKLFQGDVLTLTEADMGYADIIIMNSVIQYFSDFEEYRKAVRNLLNLIRNGILFVGDILDLEKKDCFLDEISVYGGSANRSDQWYLRDSIASLKNDNKYIKDVFITDKIGYTIQNELTKYRFDAIYEIKK